MTILLAIETSCDETSAAVVQDGHIVLSNVVQSQIELHRQYGGVFPEMASRQHMIAIIPVIREAMERAGVGWREIDAIAVVHGPGLAGSLLVGVNVAKTLAFTQSKPLVGVNHIEAHIYANWLDTREDRSTPFTPPAFPLVCLIVSGGHTELVLMTDHHTYTRLGGTVDDAAGEAFDKVARLLNLGYPGGPAIERVAVGGDPNAFELPRAQHIGPYDFSFSGLKTAVLRLVQDLRRAQGQEVDERGIRLAEASLSAEESAALPVADIAASFQAAVVEALVERSVAAIREYGAVEFLLAGGVAANKALRQAVSERMTVPVRYPPIRYCTDNAAMVGAAGYYRYLSGLRSGLDLDVVPSLALV
ncbi:MAG: tRNA (adenosine(37)-N6)-threonylcarbamoyltransferase complex transferase subunit TsaD [Chloroflexi bacterium]|nr:tRNA (adenosine(37)-N6)-threonylcarbamoyltransferase complex transferase subunit TsaD [Chloroflexota bacterium]